MKNNKYLDKFIIPFIIGVIAVTYSCLSTEKKENSSNLIKEVNINLNEKNSSGVQGKVVFSQKNNLVSMVSTLSGLTPGSHAIHIHMKSDCSSDDGKSAGGHWNPTSEKHGKWGDLEGYHKGDIGNFVADSNGNAIVEFSTDQWCIGCDDEKSNILGKAVIIHQGEDDMISQPSGAAGSRISCAGIIK
ncbi:MAG: Superoxide dismutase [Cu-Zn] [Flavobacteriaceae bacterium]|mgnify:FL=1|nr:MAG: Superoxide dismutase [Cu-Zn] [Flavobacteriaceae bacterium]